MAYLLGGFFFCVCVLVWVCHADPNKRLSQKFQGFRVCKSGSHGWGRPEWPGQGQFPNSDVNQGNAQLTLATIYLCINLFLALVESRKFKIDSVLLREQTCKKLCSGSVWLSNWPTKDWLQTFGGEKPIWQRGSSQRTLDFGRNCGLQIGR